MTHSQCRFQKDQEFTMAWIPSWAACKGNAVQLISLDNEFWTVIEVGEERPSEEVYGYSRNHKDFQHSIK